MMAMGSVLTNKYAEDIRKNRYAADAASRCCRVHRDRERKSFRLAVIMQASRIPARRQTWRYLSQC